MGVMYPSLLPAAIAAGSRDGYILLSDAVIRVICAPDDRWSYYPKHVEQFTEIQ